MGAAQVGVVTVLGVLRLDGEYADSDAWVAQTTFLAWFAVIAVAVGTAVGARPAGLGIRVSAAVAAGLGGAAGTALALVPARHAHIPNGDPRLQAGLALGIGAAAGLIFAFALLSARALLWNATAYAVLTWGLIAGAAGRSENPPHLGGLAGLGLSPDLVHSSQLWGLPVLAAVLGLLVALAARLRGHHRLAVALSGAAGPATVGLAYVIAGPGSSDVQKLPWIAALGAIVTGLAASVLVAIPPRRQPDLAATDPATMTAATGEDLPSLPSRRDWKAEIAAPAPKQPKQAPKQTPKPTKSSPRPSNDAVESWVSTLTDTGVEKMRPAADENDRPFVPRPLG